MFDLPDAKRVCRSDLYQRSQSASPTPSESDLELEAQLRARLASIYGPPTTEVPSSILAADAEPLDPDDDHEAAEETAEQEFEFRLFSGTALGQASNDENAQTQKITLVDEDEDIGGGGFVVRERSRGYYFAQPAEGERKTGIHSMAMSGEEVLDRARKRAWGLEVPWRVRVLSSEKENGKRVKQVVGVEVRQDDAKRKRPGKKRRIVLRERKKSREEMLEKKKAEMIKKEEADREKRTRRNREKKVKRKMKEKVKQADGGEDAGSGGIDPQQPPVVVSEDHTTV